jgi:hypothetical protein
MNPHRTAVVEVAAGEAEAWTTGDADLWEDNLGKAIIAALDMIQAGQQRETEILLKIKADE